MSEKEKRRILSETAFTMKAEGFEITTEQKTDLQRVLDGKITLQELKQKYIAQAREYGDKGKSKAANA